MKRWMAGIVAGTVLVGAGLAEVGAGTILQQASTSPGGSLVFNPFDDALGTLDSVGLVVQETCKFKVLFSNNTDHWVTGMTHFTMDQRMQIAGLPEFSLGEMNFFGALL